MARLLLTGLALASATIELTPDNFEKEVFESGKAAFIKFLAPWCGHCKSMKPDWDKLASAFEGSSKVLIADVDCTGTGEPLCEKYGVQGFPTIKTFAPPDQEGEDYEGGREYDDLKSHADSLGPGCSAATKENCSEEQLKELEAILAMPEADIEKELTDLKDAMTKKQEEHDELLKSLQAQYEASEAGVTELKKESAPRIKMLRAALAKPAAEGAPKDEV